MALPEPNNFQRWVETYKKDLKPPVGNKLMHGAGQTKVMVVGGPNVRKDFHLEEGEEFFFMLKGDMQLNVIERGVHRHIPIRQGEMFMLPSRIPHSPQRQADTIGLVLERERCEGEMDGLRWYVGDTDEILFEDWFHCTDLGTQLKPIIEAFMASEAHATQRPTRTYDDPKVEVDTETKLGDPINFEAWAAEHAGTNALLFDGEYRVAVMQAPEVWPAYQFHAGEVFLWQHKGSITVTMLSSAGEEVTRTMSDDDMLVIPRGTHFKVDRPAGGVGLVVTNKKVANPMVPSSAPGEPTKKASGAGAGAGAGAGSV